jgi:superfamily II DNA or RNA helicase
VKLFEELKADVIQASRDLDNRAEIVQGIEESRADRVPWLVRTGFATHLRGLRDAEILSSCELPRSLELGGWGDEHNDNDGDGDTGDDDADSDLRRILNAADGTLRDAYATCSETSPDGKMTQQRAKRLSNFRGSDDHMSNANASKFREFKNEKSLTSYFRTAKQLLVYYYRVVFRDDGHFTRESNSQVLPRDIIEGTSWQEKTMQNIINALRRQDETLPLRSGGDKERDIELKGAIRAFYISLICHTVGSRPFRSTVLSFCAMLSRKKNPTRQRDNEQRMLCTWQKPGNFNSNLSSLIWTAQVLLFDFVCFKKQDDEDGIPDMIDEICRRYFQQMAETPFGHILQWRLYLFAASSTNLTEHQARWSLDKETVDYRGAELHMDHVSQLVASEFRQAHTILYEELLFGKDDIAPVEAWRLHDDLDQDDFGASWMSHERNREILVGTHDALLRHIEEKAALRRVFIRPDQNHHNGGGGRLCPKAIAIYEAHVQEFLKRMLTLLQVPAGPPLRSPELLSITYANTGTRRRSVFIWEKMVLLYVRYHKSQEQTGTHRDNVRFLPPAVGNLLLTYLAYVPHLRQVFLRQNEPGALLSPYLWTKPGGPVWEDHMVSSCLQKASARAKVPKFGVAWWRQVAASITKEKFSAKEQANFELGESAAVEEVEDEAEVAFLAGMSNHSFRTFNHAYAGSTTLTTTTLLHRAYRASESWRTLFRIDQVLQSKRPRAVSETQSQGLLKACKKMRFRTRPTAKEEEISSIARRLYNDPDLQLRRPGQRDAILATVGPRASEQVIVVLATGSGKSLIFMIGAMLEGAGTTILILPTVALRGNMVGRLDEVAIRHHVWCPGSTKSTPIVLVSAEAACTDRFLGYANRLCDKQCLDRIVVDECHLTITAGHYRQSMSQLAWHVRQIRTQTVWLTATLPPVYQEFFIAHNKLVRPYIVRESTNRRNIRYSVRRQQGLGTLCERASHLVQSYRAQSDLFRSQQDRIIIYCPTKALVAELATMLGCLSYTAESGTEQEKREIIERWLTAADSPVVVATAALGPGFDYPHIRLVLHVGAPRLLTDFSQESGRAGRDGHVAESIILLSAAWQPQFDRTFSADEEAMQVYLMQDHCSRGVLSQFLDMQSDWRWCMEDDELCGVCPTPHAQRRPPTLEFHLSPTPLDETAVGQDRDNGRIGQAVATMEFTGPAEVLRQTQVCDSQFSQYERDLEIMKGCCLYCRVEGKPFEHTAAACARRFDWIQAKKKALQDCQRRKKKWMDPHAVCWKCYQPQEICRAADPAYEGDKSCQYPDMVIPLCFGAFCRLGHTQWFLEHFYQSFKTCHDYMLWLGKGAYLGSSRCVNATCVAALLLGEFE